MTTDVTEHRVPKEVHFLISMVCALLLAVFYLWNESRTQWSWIVSTNTKIAGLQAESKVATALDRQSKAIEELTRIIVEGE